MATLLTTLLAITIIILLMLGISNAYCVKLSINSIKNRNSYLFVITNIFIAIVFVISYCSYLVLFSFSYTQIAFITANFVFLLSAIFMYLASILTREMGGLLYKLDAISKIDSLTGIYNRGYIEKRMGREFNRDKRYNRLACLVMIDINNFKHINDTYGHQMGDKVLILVAQTLLDLRRENDIVGRYGGDEFLIILPETDSVRAYFFIERLKRELAKRCFQQFGNSLSFTISVGANDIQEEHQTYHQWLHSADINLYATKKQFKHNVA